MSHGDDIVVKNARRHGLRMLLHEKSPFIGNTVKPRYRPGGFFSLPWRETVPRMGKPPLMPFVTCRSVDEAVQPPAGRRRGETGMVRRSFIREPELGGKGLMMDEASIFGENMTQYTGREPALPATMQLGNEVGGSEMHASIVAVTAWADCSGIGAPHRSCTVQHAQESWLPAPYIHNQIRATAPEAKTRGQFQIGHGPRGKETLRHSHFHQALHLGQPLQGRLLGIGDAMTVRLGGKVPQTHSPVVMGGPDDTVEIVLASYHGNPARGCRGGISFSWYSVDTG